MLKLVPSPSASGEPATAEELAHEAKICSRLNHPAIVRMYDFFEHGDNLVLVFEHFAGVSLARLLSHFRRRRQRVPDAAVWYLSHRLFAALSHAHALVDEKGHRTPVIHRDIQPAHLVMSHDAHVRLAGFGIAKIAGTASNTAVGFVKGTPAYMAPEQASGEKINERVDVYAAGLVVWEMLSGRSVRPPREVGQGAELLKLIAGRRFDPISSLRRDIPREIAAAIDACLVQSAAKRTIQCREVERWLEKVVDVEAGKKQLRERLVQLRSANVRSVPAPRASVSPRASQPPQNPNRALPSRFPGVATRVTGRPSERDEGEAPRSSRRIPPLRASSYPAPALSPEHEEPARKTAKRTLLGMAPAADLPPIDHTPRAPSPSYDALPPPPPTSGEEISAFVANLKRPPGVDSARGNDLLDVSDVVDIEELTVDDEASEAPVQPSRRPSTQAEPQIPVGDPADRATGDTTIISRQRFEQARQRQGVILIAGSIGIAVVAVVSIGGWFAVKALSTTDADPISTPGSSAVSVASPVVSAPVSAPVSATVTAAAVESAVAKAGPTTPPAPSNMPGYLGAVYVHGPPEGTVYVSGVPLGETGEWIEIACNRHHFVRVGTKPGPLGLRGTAWLAAGQSVMIRCGKGVEVTATPRYAAPDRPIDPGGAGGKFEPNSPF